MPRARTTDGLSEAARGLMARGFAAGWTAERIALAIRDETGETAAARTISRRAAEWRKETARRKLAREQMEDLVAAAEKGDAEVSGFIRALALETLQRDPEALMSADPIELHGLSLEAEKMRLKRREMEIRERRVAVDEKRLALLEEREKRAVVALTDQSKPMTDLERVNAVRAIFQVPEVASIDAG